MQSYVGYTKRSLCIKNCDIDTRMEGEDDDVSKLKLVV
jgi:hypothetical protein